MEACDEKIRKQGVGARADVSTSGLVFFKAGTDFLSSRVYMLRALSTTREKEKATARVGGRGRRDELDESQGRREKNEKKKKRNKKRVGGRGEGIRFAE